jgi:predicted nuclease of predicted toxin-antitoxin system
VKLLFDQNLSFKLAGRLDDLFAGSSQARLLALDKADDADLWDHARQHGFTLVTKDADFAERSALLGHPPKVLWLRCGNQKTDYIERLIRARSQEILAFGQDPNSGCLEIY